ncbi:uncharacterized protein LOC143282231 [Babylonia areolata]|uniref:uncharacterized protein LOC143282231 n=1 Tax=Babylonia areolata TaxID=304850 RepID=UPI003FD33ACD
MSAAPKKLAAPHGVCVGALLLGLWLWVVLSGVSAARPMRYTLPSFLDTPVNITAYRGMDVELPCVVRNLGTKVVVWKKVHEANPITIGEFLYAPDPSYEVLRPKLHESPEWNLRIKDVQPVHAGTYECQVSTKDDITRNVTLTVIDANGAPDKPVPPKKHDGNKRLSDEAGIRLDGNEYVEKGNPIVLNCTATGIDYRPKGVDWFKDGSKVRSDAHVLITESSDGNVLHSTLEVQRSNMSDAGTYVCRSTKFHVASKKVNVLNTDTINKRRESEKDGMTSGQTEVRHLPPSAGRSSSSLSACPSSVLLLLLFLFLFLHHQIHWPTLPAALLRPH